MKSICTMWPHQEMNSIFYVDSDYDSLTTSNTKMETEVRSLKQELTRTREALKSATKRCRELVRELDSLNVCHESERCLRDQQLSRILRALLVLESRLRQEQKSIRQQLCEKDNVIRNQQLEIARLRRYTKNYIKNKREQGTNKNSTETNDVNTNSEDLEGTPTTTIPLFNDGSLDKDIQSLKREIVIKLNHQDDDKNRNKDYGVRKTDSFAGSDVSKESLTSEITDGSIITTTDGSASLLSTEGFCEGESSDISPGSTLHKSCSRRTTSDSDTEPTRTILHNSNDHISDNNDDDNFSMSRRIGITRTEPLQIHDIGITTILRSDSKDDGLDCTFASEDEEQTEPIYVNDCTKNNVNNLRECDNRPVNEINCNNNNGRIKIIQEEKSLEETSGNWYSDPDEDRISDDVFRHNSSYRPNSNHNSVLECVNQILLRDMEEEENVSSVPRTFKHRGRIVRFQSARLSDIESVGSEMERRNSEETTMDKETEAGNFESTCSEDEFGMRIDPPIDPTMNSGSIGSESSHEDELEDSQLARAIPIVIIEPTEDIDVRSDVSSVSPDLSMKSKSSNRSSSPILRLERIEEKTCLSMSSKGLTIAKNLDYEDIESLPEIVSPSPKTPPALPPKPQFRNNTLILKKIPSPSFLIDETRKKNSPAVNTPAYVKKFLTMSSPNTKSSIGSSARSLVFDNKAIKSPIANNNYKDKNKFKSSSPSKNYKDHIFCDISKAPRVTNIVRHFEEFKIGGDTDNRRINKSLDRRPPLEIEEMDFRQNFEEFNLDECDLSDDPDRLDGDGSERLGNNTTINNKQENDSFNTGDNNNSGYINNNSNGIYDHFLEATGLSTKSILTPSRLLSNHKSMLKPKDIKYKNKIKAGGAEKHNNVLPTTGNTNMHVRHWSGPFV